MSRTRDAFTHGKAFIPFVTAGDPSLDLTRQLIVAMAKEGADLIEIGIPFSDPVAEGPVIQAADERALGAGTTIDGIFDMVGQVRKETDIPLVFMTYVNPIFTYGCERFFGNCSTHGIDAVIVPDLPFEEKEEIAPYCDRFGIDLISLVAPTSKDRIRMIAREAKGFVYCVSSMGVTGVRTEITTDLSEMVRLVKEEQDIPCAIGFGISTPKQAKAMAQYADGVIVGSAIVRIVAEHGLASVGPVSEYVRAMKNAIRSVR